MPQVNRSVSFGAALLTAVLTLSATACSSGNDRPSTPVAGESPATTPADPAPTTPETPTTPATPDVSTPTAPSALPTTLTDYLLPTASVPGLNARWHWKDGTTGPAGTRPFGLCARADLLSIGATDVAERTYFPPVDTGDQAAQQVADFPDATTTATAFKVLTSWQQRCASHAPRGTTLSAGPSHPVEGGSWYLVTRTTANPDDAGFEQLGIVRLGTRISVLRIDSVARHFSYPAGSEPVVAMVAAAARLLGS